MELSTEMLELIDQYLNGELSREEHDDFKVQLAKNKELQKLVGEQRLIKVGIEQSAEAALKKKLNGIHERLALDVSASEDSATSGKIVEMKPSGYRKWLALAASFLLLITIGFFSLDYLTKERAVADNNNNTDRIDEDLLATPRNLKATKSIKHSRIVIGTNNAPNNITEKEEIALKIYREKDYSNTYSFSGKELLIFDGTIELSGNEQFQVWEIKGMNSDGFYLSVDDNYYSIQINEEKQQLKANSNKALEKIIESN